MSPERWVCRVLWATMAAIAVGAVSVSAQQYPLKPINIITTQPGSSTDIVLRLLAPGLTAGLGQPVVIHNRGGAIGPAEVAKSPPDGHSLIVMANALWIQPLMRDESWDVVRDFAPITIITDQPLALLVNPYLPVKSVKELIVLAKAKPGTLNIATGTTGTTNHLAGELFKLMAGVNIVQVPYKGNVAGNIAVITGESQLTFALLAPSLPFVKSGKLKLLGVTTASSSGLMPGVPAVAEAVPGFALSLPTGVWAPAGIPNAVTQRLVTEFKRALAQPDIREKIISNGNDIVGSSPEELMSVMKADVARLSKITRVLRQQGAASGN